MAHHPDELDEATLYVLATIDRIRSGADGCLSGGLSSSPNFLTLDEYAALLETREIDGAGLARCTGWSTSRKRRCLRYGGGQRAYPRWSECCAHPGVWLDQSGIGSYVCESH